MEKVEEDIWARATKATDDLYHVKETFFPANPDDKVSKLQNESDLALRLLDSVPPGTFSTFSSYPFRFFSYFFGHPCVCSSVSFT